MRRDIFIENDSGGLSVIAAAAADAIIEDGRENDLRFVEGHQALLLMLYGDDSLPVRVVVDEPLTADEEREWLARVSWKLDAPDGRLLVMGGFDPDVLAWWRDAGDPDADGRGVGVIAVSPGSWRVDLYTHAGSMNGRAILDELDEPVGAFFRRSHPDRRFPVWLAHTLEFDGEDDPGHEGLWRDVAASIESGELAIDTELASAIGFVVHLTPFDGPDPQVPDGGWFDWEDGRRVPDVCPVGLPAQVPDPEGEWFLDRALRRERPAEPPPVATAIVEIIESWPGDPLRALEGGAVAIGPSDAFHLYWIAGLASDSPPAFELWVDDAPGWVAPAPTAEFGVVEKSGGIVALGAPLNSGGWWLWWGARAAAQTLSTVPDGASLDLAMTPRVWEDDELDPAVGRALYSGRVENGEWKLTEVSPAVSADTLNAALAFVRVLEAGYVTVRSDAEREALESAARVFQLELAHEGDYVGLTDPDERFLLMLAEPVFRTRFGGELACDPIDS